MAARPVRWPWAVVWGLRYGGAALLASWVVPVSTYEVSEFAERARFTLGWPDPWYESVASIESGEVTRVDDLVRRPRPIKPLGRRDIWQIHDRPPEVYYPGPGVVGWTQDRTERVRRTRVRDGPLGPSIIGAGCLVIAALMTRDRRRLAIRYTGPS